MSQYDLQASESSVISASANWIAGTLTGTLGLSVTVVAVAWFGFMMLRGSLDIGRGLRIVMGCFVLFGAPSIAQGLLELARIGEGSRPTATVQPIAAPDATSPKPQGFDPYAGAAVPN